MPHFHPSIFTKDAIVSAPPMQNPIIEILSQPFDYKNILAPFIS